MLPFELIMLRNLLCSKVEGGQVLAISLRYVVFIEKQLPKTLNVPSQLSFNYIIYLFCIFQFSYELP